MKVPEAAVTTCAAMLSIFLSFSLLRTLPTTVPFPLARARAPLVRIPLTISRLRDAACGRRARPAAERKVLRYVIGTCCWEGKNARPQFPASVRRYRTGRKRVSSSRGTHALHVPGVACTSNVCMLISDEFSTIREKCPG